MALLSIRATPKSSRNRVEVDGDLVRVWVTAPPTDGEANLAVIRTVADALGVPPSRIAILKGHGGREKQLEIDGLSEEALAVALSLLDS